MFKAKSNSKLINSCIISFEKCIKILDKLTNEEFNQKPYDGSTIGAHMRHIIDRANCVLSSLHHEILDYDNRLRNKDIEENIVFCKNALQTTIDKMAQIPLQSIKSTIKIKETISEDGSQTIIESPIEREFLDIFNHTIHHIATVKVICQSFGIKLGDDIAKTPSTKIYEQTES